MRKLLIRRSIVFAGLAVLAVALLLLGRGADDASATHGTTVSPPRPFDVSYSVSLSSSGVGDAATVTQTSGTGVFDPFGSVGPPSLGGHIPTTGVIFTPADWTVVPGSLIPLGDPTGLSATAITLGLFNAAPPCIFTTGVIEPLINATTDSKRKLVTTTNVANLVVDDLPPAGDGVPNGADYYPDVLAAAIPPKIVGDPLQRSYLQIIGFLGSPTNVVADVVTYAPDQLVPLGLPPGLGYATVIIIENFSSVLPPNPSIITDQCGFQTTLISPGGLRFNPGTPGTKLFNAMSQSRLDADNDGFDNDADRCPFTPDDPLTFADLGLVPPLPPVDTTLPKDSDFNGVPDSCDPGTADFGDPCIPDNTLLCFGLDGDGDTFSNAQDDCFAVSDILQTESEGVTLAVPTLAGPVTDAIGDACDPNPTVADGHFHTATALVPVCITGGGVVDSDDDGWCDGDEDDLGSDKNDDTSTPENISVQGVCGDGLDNDGDDDVDTFGDGNGASPDSGCTGPAHDLSIKKLTQSSSAIDSTGGTGSLTQQNTLQIKNNTGSDETVTFMVLVDPIENNGCSGPSVKVTGGAKNVTDGQANSTDFDDDVEGLALGLVDVKANGITTVHFTVTYPECLPGEGDAPNDADYTLFVDICHGNDPTPLSLLAGVGGPNCPGSSDGGVDIDLTNDTPASQLINDVGS